MPESFTTKNLLQDAVLWSWDGTSVDDDGVQTVGAATAIKVRWQEKYSEVTEPNGSTVAISDKVAVKQDIKVGSILWLGALADLPSPPTNLRQVHSVDKSPGIKARKTRRQLNLIKYSDTLPDLA